MISQLVRSPILCGDYNASTSSASHIDTNIFSSAVNNDDVDHTAVSTTLSTAIRPGTTTIGTATDDIQSHDLKRASIVTDS